MATQFNLTSAIMVTLLVVGLFLWAIVGSFATWAVCLRLGLKFAGIADVRWRSVFTIALLVTLVNFFFIAAIAALPPILGPSEAKSLLGFAIGTAIACVLIRAKFATGLGKTLLVWAPTLIATVSGAVFLEFVYRPFIGESFTAPTNAMAPTLVGPHVVAKCSDCGGEAFGALLDPEFISDRPRMTICVDHFHINEGSISDESAHAVDRFLTLKFLKPKRWDLITFRVPFAPQEIYVKRVVGLPGETITIKDGEVWANGERLTPPAEIGEIQYTSEVEEYPIPLWGSEDRPANLSDDEYFVLGDFTAVSADSRFWREGAPGHSPFAVPESHVLGVVTHIYWPLGRMRAFR